MVKKRATGRSANSAQQTLKDADGTEWVEKLPKPLQDEVDTFLKLMRQKHTLARKERESRERCIALMRKHEIEKIVIDEGKKYLVADDKTTLKTVAVPKEDREE